MPRPRDADALASLAVELPPLAREEAAAPPVGLDHLLEYLRIESTPGLTADDLHFLRTAAVNDASYWIWEFSEPDGTRAYATISRRSDAPPNVGYDIAGDLTPEQFIVGDYHGLI